MEIIDSIDFCQSKAVKMFRSVATVRKNDLRIHYHSMIEMSLIVKGNGYYQTKSGKYSISPGNLFFFRPNEFHYVTDIFDDGMELLNLHIAPYYLYTNFQNALQSDYIRILSALQPLISNCLNDFVPAPECDRLRAALLAVRAEFEEKRSDYVLQIQNYISSFLITVSRCNGNDNNVISNRKNYHRMAEAMAYIDANFCTELSLAEIATHVGYSRCYFSSVFKECIGMSPWDYISIKRIEQALTMLKTTDRSVLEIATACGFNNTVNFCKIFKKYTNLSPSAWRK